MYWQVEMNIIGTIYIYATKMVLTRYSDLNMYYLVSVLKL